MTKIRITERQYKLILLHKEQNKFIIKEVDNTITTDLDVILGVSSLMGIQLTGYNKINAENALNKESTFNKIKNVLESKDKLDELVKSLGKDGGKGMDNPSKKIFDKMSTIIDEFHKTCEKNGYKISLNPKAITNLKSLDVQD